MPERLGQKSVLITGCTPGGIGHGLCHEFHKQGLHVIATARDLSVLKELAALGMSTVQLDVTDPISIKKCHKVVTGLTGGRLDILVNNAGRTHTHPALDLDIQDVRTTFETNVFGVMAMVAGFSDLLIEAQGLVINVASLAALVPYAFGSAYCASKGAIVSYSRTLRQELRPLGVRVMVCMVGTVKSNIHNRAHRSLPEDSVYQPIKEVFQKRLTFVNNNSPYDTESFSKELVANSLKSEVPWLFRSWVGRPDWFYYGGLAWLLWWGSTLFGEWVVDYVCWRMFELWKLENLRSRVEEVHDDKPSKVE
ncbi:hypothetical protein N7504_001369 [Penicillium tannophilum]|nr:hypothetical protein N7504_001369 [Penicillium tannophilum]